MSDDARQLPEDLSPELDRRLQERAAEMGWSLEYEEGPTWRRLVAIDPEEPPPLDRIVVDVLDRSWQAGAKDLGLIDQLTVADIFDMDMVTDAMRHNRFLLLQMIDGSRAIGLCTRVGDHRYGRGDELIDCSLSCVLQEVVKGRGRMNNHSARRVKASQLRQLSVLPELYCDGCHQPLGFAPWEHGDNCPNCGAFAENPDFANQETTCKDCGAIKPCRCDIASKATPQATGEPSGYFVLQQQGTTYKTNVDMHSPHTHKWFVSPGGLTCQECGQFLESPATQAPHDGYKDLM